jgi:hypothetical protein
VRCQQASPETAPFESGFLESPVPVGSIYNRNSSETTGSLMAGGELVRSPVEDLRRKVPAHFATEGALDVDGLKWEFLDAG